MVILINVTVVELLRVEDRDEANRKIYSGVLSWRQSHRVV